MAKLSLNDLFGYGATYNEATTELTFKLSNLNDDLNEDVIYPNSITAQNIDSYGGRIIWAILHRIYLVQPADNNEEDRSLYITNQGRRSAVRNNVSQFAFQFVANGYIDDYVGTSVASFDLV